MAPFANDAYMLVVDERQSSDATAPPTANRQLPTANRQPLTANR